MEFRKLLITLACADSAAHAQKLEGAGHEVVRAPQEGCGSGDRQAIE